MRNITRDDIDNAKAMGINLKDFNCPFCWRETVLTGGVVTHCIEHPRKL